MRDEGPTKGDMFGPVVEAILFREGNGRGAILIEGSGSCLSETQFVCKLEQIDCFLCGGGESYNFARAGSDPHWHRYGWVSGSLLVLVSAWLRRWRRSVVSIA